MNCPFQDLLFDQHGGTHSERSIVIATDVHTWLLLGTVEFGDVQWLMTRGIMQKIKYLIRDFKITLYYKFRKYVVVVTHFEGVGATFGPFSSKDKAQKWIDKRSFPDPEAVVIRPLHDPNFK